MGYHYRRSGDILVVPEPGYYTFGRWSSPIGTTHGEWNPYDAHIPLLFYGWNVSHGATRARFTSPTSPLPSARCCTSSSPMPAWARLLLRFSDDWK